MGISRTIALVNLRALSALVLGLSTSSGCLRENEAEAPHDVGVQTQKLRFADNCSQYLQPGYAEALEQAQERAYRAIRYAFDVYSSVPQSAEGDWAFGAGHDRNVVFDAFATVVHFLDIEDHRGERQLEYECGTCSNPDFVAETTFLSPLNVRLCFHFWEHPISDWTYMLQHEYFHWALVSDDLAYADDAIELARTNPEYAVQNADNYAQYVDWLSSNP